MEKIIKINRPLRKCPVVYTTNGYSVCRECNKIAKVYYAEDEVTGKVTKYKTVCDCGENFYSKEEFDYTTRDGDSYEDMESGVTMKENGNISLYHLSKRWFVPRRDIRKGRPRHPRYILCVRRLTINPKTGRTYWYHKDLGTRVFTRLDWTENSMSIEGLDDEVCWAFVKTVLEESGLPVRFKVRKEAFVERFVFSCGDTEIKFLKQTFAKTNVMRFLCDLIAAPNFFIKYDEYNGKCGFYGHRFASSLRASNARKIQPAHLMDSEEYIKLMCDKLNLIKSPRMKTIYREDPHFMFLCSFLCESGITHIEHQLRTVNLSGRMEMSAFNRKLFKAFLKQIVKEKGEGFAVSEFIKHLQENKVTDTEGVKVTYWLDGIASDMLSMWSLLYPEARKQINFSQTFKNLHDQIFKVYNHQRTINVPISYTNKELNREKSYEDYTLRAASDTDQLVDIGEKMHICVGAYGMEAVKKKTTIYYLVDNDERYQACIEVRGDRLVQAKGYCNDFLEGKVAQTVMQWVDDVKLKHSDCIDYDGMQLA